MPDIVENSDLSYKQRIDLIKHFFMASNIQLLEINNFDDNFIAFTVKMNKKILKLNILAKNVVNSGWADKPLIKRIQVVSFKNKKIPSNSHISSSLFLGIAFVNEKPIFAVWNPFMFVFHNTNRSCYVNVESLARCYHLGFVKTIDSKNTVLLCDENNFDKLINIYFIDNAVDTL